MIDNIKDLYNALEGEYKRLAINTLAADSGLSVETIRANWIYRMSIPEKNQPRTVEILQGLHRIQEEERRRRHEHQIKIIAK